MKKLNKKANLHDLIHLERLLKGGGSGTALVWVSDLFCFIPLDPTLALPWRRSEARGTIKELIDNSKGGRTTGYHPDDKFVFSGDLRIMEQDSPRSIGMFYSVRLINPPAFWGEDQTLVFPSDPRPKLKLRRGARLYFEGFIVPGPTSCLQPLCLRTSKRGRILWRSD